MAFSNFLKRLLPAGPKPVRAEIPALPPAYVPPSISTGTLGKGRNVIKGFVPVGPEPIPGTYIPPYSPPRIEGLEDVDLSPTYAPREHGEFGSGRSPVGKFVPAPKYGDAWIAKYPEFAAEGRDLEEIGDEGGDWIPAPPDSHVESMRYFPAKLREKSFARRLVQDSGDSMIDIRFKPNGTNGTTEYRYWFPNNEQWLADEIWHLLIGADHPGEIVHAYLIDLRIRYKRIS